jgi:pilus assembly protein Flp/PilA
MSKLISKVQAYWECRDGATAIEYGLIAGGISLAIVASVFTFGDNLANVFSTASTAMGNAATEIETNNFIKGGSLIICWY